MVCAQPSFAHWLKTHSWGFTRLRGPQGSNEVPNSRTVFSPCAWQKTRKDVAVRGVELRRDGKATVAQDSCGVVADAKLECSGRSLDLLTPGRPADPQSVVRQDVRSAEINVRFLTLSSHAGSRGPVHDHPVVGLKRPGWTSFRHSPQAGAGVSDSSLRSVSYASTALGSRCAAKIRQEFRERAGYAQEAS